MKNFESRVFLEIRKSMEDENRSERVFEITQREGKRISALKKKVHDQVL